MIVITAWDLAGALTGVLALVVIFAIGSFMYWGFNQYLVERRSCSCDLWNAMGWEEHLKGVPGLEELGGEDT